MTEGAGSETFPPASRASLFPIRRRTFDKARSVADSSLPARKDGEAGVKDLATVIGAVGFAVVSAASAQTAPGPATPPAPEPARIHRTETIVEGNWTVTCAQTDQAGTRHCSAILRITDADKAGAKRVLFAWVLGHKDGRLTSVITVPTGVLIPPGLEMKIGDKETRKVGYSLCQPDHCEAVLPLDDLLVKSLSAAATTDVTVAAVNGAQAKFTVNMKGFPQALADIRN
jgi:invasion protein IalB